MDWEQKLFIAADIARGLQFLHEVKETRHYHIC
jgi:hypothetical protein